MNTKDHVEFGNLALFVLHGLEKEEAVPIEQHVRRCSGCQRELVQVQEVLGLYAQLTKVQETPRGSRAKVLDQVAQEKKAVSRPWPVQIRSCDVGESMQRGRSLHTEPATPCFRLR